MALHSLLKPFMNSPEGFKFLIDVRYVDKEYKKGAHHVHPDAIALFQEWYGIKHISSRLTQSLADIDNRVQNLSLLNHVNEGGLQYLIINLWQVPSFPETRLRKEADSTTKKLGKLKL